MKLLIAVLLLALNIVSLSAQIDDHSRNALPPGPTRIFGTVVDQHHKPIPKLIVRVSYPDGVQRDADNFTAQESGSFSVHVFRADAEHITLDFMSDQRVLHSKHYNAFGPGRNIGSPYDTLTVHVPKRFLKKLNRP